MKKFTFLLVAAALMYSVDVFSQTTYMEVEFNLPKHFKVGDRLYSSTYQGLNSLMNDLKLEDNEVYNNLLPNYNLIQKKRNTALLGGGACAIVGVSMVGFGVNKTKNQMTSDSFGDPNWLSGSDSGAGLILAGGITTLVSVILYAILAPNENDIYNFINSHNKFNSKAKMEWEIGLNVLPNNSFGLSLRSKF